MQDNEGVWRLECKYCTKQTAEEMDQLLTSCKFFNANDEDTLLMKCARDLRTTIVTVTKANSEQHTVSVSGFGDSSSLTDLIHFIKAHGTEVFPSTSIASSNK